jgi:excisionase family DNA binding protein
MPRRSDVISAEDAERWTRVSGLELLKAGEAAIYLRVGVRTLEEAVSRGEIPFVRPAGADRRWLRSDLDAYLARIREAEGGERDPKSGTASVDAQRWTRVAAMDWLLAEDAAFYVRRSLGSFNEMVKTLPIPFIRPMGPKGERLFYRSHIDAALLARTENTGPSRDRSDTESK